MSLRDLNFETLEKHILVNSRKTLQVKLTSEKHKMCKKEKRPLTKKTF